MQNRKAQGIVNPVTGERIVFRRTSTETGGMLLEFDDHWTRPGHRVPEHVHPKMDERWEVLEGTAMFRIAGKHIRVGPGDVVMARAGEPHTGWSLTDEEVHLRVQMRPALRWEEVIKRLFSLAEQGRVDEGGLPVRDEVERLLRDFPDEIGSPDRDVARITQTPKRVAVVTTSGEASTTALSGMDWFPLVFDVPLIKLIGAAPVDPADPVAGLSFVVGDDTLNAAGALHGGVLGTVLDLAAYLSVIPTLGAGEQAVTHALSTSYLAGVRVGERLTARGTLLRRTRRLAFASSSVIAGDRLIATATVTKSILGGNK